MIRLYAIAILTVLVVSVVTVSCDKVPLTSPTGSTIALSIDKTILPVNGQATVKAVVTESAGTAPQNGTMVTFQPSIGRTEPIDAPTINGVATVTFLAGTVSGSGVIHAFSGSARTGSGNSSAGGVSVQIGSAAVGSVSLNVVPASIPQSGGAVSVTALVLDSGSNPLPGVAVNFSTDQGTLGSTTVFSDQSGRASTTLQTNRTTVVTATVGAQKGTFTVGIAAAPIVTIALATGAGTPTVGTAVPFAVTPGTSTNSSPLASVTVNFGDGGAQTFTNVTGPFGLTHTYNSAGGYTVSATAVDINGQVGVSSTAVVISFAALPTATLSVLPNPVPPASQGLATFTVGALAAPNGPPIRSVRVTLADGTVIFTGTGGGTFAYRFGGGGTYTATATVTDAAGAVGTTTTAILVQPW